jgi:hypothetical protein
MRTTYVYAVMVKSMHTVELDEPNDEKAELDAYARAVGGAGGAVVISAEIVGRHPVVHP